MTTHPPSSSPPDMAKAILEFVLNQNPSLQSLDPVDDPELFKTEVGDMLTDIMLGEFETGREGNEPIDKLCRQSNELDGFMDALQHIAMGHINATDKLHLQNAPDLIGLLADHWDYLAEQSRKDVKGFARTDFEEDSDLAQMFPWVADQDRIHELMSASLESARHCRWGAANMRQHILPMVRQLAAALNVTLNEPGKGGPGH